MSVRPPSGEIRTISEPLPAALSADRKLIRIPFLRGMFLLYETLVIGTRMLMRSASIAAEEEDVELKKNLPLLSHLSCQLSSSITTRASFCKPVCNLFMIRWVL
jgi:uncharacterized protein YqhQ